MKAGRELDALVAEKVMGLKVSRNAGSLAMDLAWHDAEGWHPIGSYSADIAAAWQVVDRLIGLHFREIQVRHWIDPFDTFMSVGWMCKLEDDDVVIAERADTAPLAISLAALKAVGVEVPS